MLWPLAVYFFLILFLVAAVLGLSRLLEERHHEPATDQPYESGMVPTGSARARFPAEFYLVAMFFVIFDLETAFIVAWAVAARPLGWPGYIELAVFVGVLLAALVYLWRTGAIDWRTPRQRRDLARVRARSSVLRTAGDVRVARRAAAGRGGRT